MTRTTKLVLAGLVASLGFGTVALAKGGPGGPGGPHGSPMMRIIQDLDLTDAQKEEAQAIRDSVRAEKEAAHEAREAFMDGMLEELATGAPDRARITALEDAAHAAMTDAATARTQALLDFYDTLTPEQQQQLVAELEEGRARMQEHREEGRGGRGGPHGDRGPEGEGDW